MVFTKLSRALLLVSLLSLCSLGDMNNDDLEEIIKHFHEKFQGTQYAAAINVPKDNVLSFLKEASNVREHLKNHLTYEGTELIVANFSEDRHSEDLLMNPPNHSPLTNLLTTRGSDRYVVFYTLLSPCIDRCLSNNNNNNNILSGLDELKAHTGIKAFAFTHIYRRDQDKNNLREELGKVAARVPLYRCLYKCILCGTPVLTIPIKEECTMESTSFLEYINKLHDYNPSNGSG